jgi:hypothetical protein
MTSEDNIRTGGKTDIKELFFEMAAADIVPKFQPKAKDYNVIRKGRQVRQQQDLLTRFEKQRRSYRHY